jgi:hypothetical protein
MLYQLSYAGVALAYNAALLPLHLARHVISIAPFILASGFGLAHVRAEGGQLKVRRFAETPAAVLVRTGTSSATGALTGMFGPAFPSVCGL